MKIYVVCAQLILVLALSKAASADCNMTVIPKANIYLREYMGQWFEIRYNATDHPEEESWSDYSETYIQDVQDENRVQIIYSSRSQGNSDCSHIVSKRLFYYTQMGTFILTKNKLNYTYVVTYADLSDYRYAVVVMCPYILSNGMCNTTLDVKTFSRKNRAFDNATESRIQNFFAEELPCIDYNELRETSHTDSPCTYGSGVSLLVAGHEKLIILMAFVIGSLCTRRGIVWQ